MKLIKKDCFFYLSKVEEHKEIKETVLELIQSIGNNALIDNASVVDNTDWILPSNHPREYSKIVLPIFYKYINAIGQNSTPVYYPSLTSYWYQQYEKGNYHGWHTHGNCAFSNIYYLELPEGSSKTTFRLNDEEFEVDVKEGDLLTFPGHFFHCSKENKSDKRKTIISFNYIINNWHQI